MDYLLKIGIWAVICIVAYLWLRKKYVVFSKKQILFMFLGALSLFSLLVLGSGVIPRYSTIRIAFLAVICIAIFLALRKKYKIFSKKLIIYSVLGFSIVYSLLMYTPFENAFMNFPSAEAAWRYQHSGEYVMTIEAEESSLVISRNDSATQFSVYPKTESGWKLITWTNPEKQRSVSVSDPFFYAAWLRLLHSNDVFIFVYDYANGDVNLPSQISDNLGSRFTKIDLDSTEPYAQYITWRTYYTIVPAATNDYKLTLGTQTITLNL